MADTNKDILARANAAVSRGDHEAFLALCTEDTEWTFIGDRVIKGKQALREWMAATYKEPPSFDVDRMIEEGDGLAVLGHITLKDDQGHETRSAYCDVWRLRDGKLAGLTAYVIEQ